jgi:PTS system mannose-specific IIA component
VIGIVIVAHGGLAREFLAAVQHVVGRQTGIIAVSIEADFDGACKRDEICAAADSVDTGGGVVVATDMFGGSPSNLSLLACRASNRRIVYGVNLPLLVKLAKSRRLPVAEAVRVALAAGRKYLDALDLSEVTPPATPCVQRLPEGRPDRGPGFDEVASEPVRHREARR